MTGAPDPGDGDPRQHLDLTRAMLRQCRTDRDALEQDVLNLHSRLFETQQRAERAEADLLRVTSSRSHRVLAPARRLGAQLAQRRSVGAPEGTDQTLSDDPVDPGEATLRVEVLEPGQIALDVSALTDPARTGIARVIVQLGGALHEEYPDRSRLVLQEGGHLVIADKFATEVTGQTSLPGPATRLVASPGSVLLSTSVATPDEVNDWFLAVDEFRTAGGVYVQFVHDILPMTMPDFFAPAMRAHFPLWLERVCSRADGILTNSQVTLADLHDVARARAWPVPAVAASVGLGHDGLAAGASGPHTRADAVADVEGVTVSPDSFVILAVGTIEPRKGYDALMNAAEELMAETPRVSFVVAGRTGWADADTLARLRLLSDSRLPFTWFDGISDQGLRSLYQRADLLVAPSRGEGFGLPVAEAMAVGAPVLARDLPVFRELLGEGGSYFEIDSELTGALRVQYDQPAPTIGGDALSTWSNMAIRIVTVLDDANRAELFGVR